jgi:hypothetical protein
MLDKDIQEAREELNNQVEIDNLQSEPVLTLIQRLDALVLHYYNKSFDDERRKLLYERLANIIINTFLRQNNLSINDLKYRANVRERNELIVRLRGEAGFSIRETARYLGLNEGLVQISMKKFKNPTDNDILCDGIGVLEVKVS